MLWFCAYPYIACCSSVVFYFVRQNLWQGVIDRRLTVRSADDMSVEQAFRRMIRREIEAQLRPLKNIVARLQDGTSDLGVLRGLAERLSPLASLFASGPAVRSGPAPRRRGR